MRRSAGSALWSLAFVLLAARASAQSQTPQNPGQPVGVRAAGMGGAFTAVADDASAAYWNPAGLATGSLFSAVLDANLLDRRSGWLVALGTPPLGLTYYRTAIAEVANGRNTLVAHHAGVSVLQSVGDHMTVGTTLKVVHGIGSAAGGSRSSTRFDADLGVMIIGSLAQFGVTVHNLLEPEFKTSGDPIRLDRRVRAGAAVHVRQDTLVAADLDLTNGQSSRGNWRDAAVGVESHPVTAAWLRAGVHWNAQPGALAGSTGKGSAAPVASLGGSYAVYGSTLVDAQVSFGAANGDRGWGVGLRFVF